MVRSVLDCVHFVVAVVSSVVARFTEVSPICVVPFCRRRYGCGSVVEVVIVDLGFWSVFCACHCSGMHKSVMTSL